MKLELVSNSGSHNNTPKNNLDGVRNTIVEQFDERIWNATEAALSVHMALLLGDVKRCAGLIIEGPPSSGKTTTVRFLEGLDNAYLSDDATPASFVSHDASKTADQLKDVDLLPRIKHKALLNPDMGNWFSGHQEAIDKRWSRMARVMDGRGLLTDSGVHGQRGYEGDYRFACIGATTPIDPRAWKSMGHLGPRFVFHEMPASSSTQEVRNNVFGGGSYEQKVRTCRDSVQRLVELRWDDLGGYGSVNWPSRPVGEIEKLLVYLANVITHARANEGEHPESSERVTAALYDIARGRALLDGRTDIEICDLRVCARIALSTMPQRRRGIVRHIVNPRNTNKFTAGDIAKATSVSLPTAGKRMELIGSLGIGNYYQDDSRGTQYLTLNSEFEWRRGLKFPHFNT